MKEVLTFSLLGLIWGSEWVATSRIDLPPVCSVAIRQALAAVILLVIWIAQRIRLPGPRVLLLSGLSGVTMLTLPVLLLAYASGHISPGLLAVILAMTPLVTALLEGRAIGVLLAPLVGGVGGTALLASQALSFDIIQFTGSLAALVAVCSIAWSIVFIRRALLEVAPLTLTTIQFCVSFVLLGVASIGMEGPFSVALTTKEWILEGLLVVFGSVLAYCAYYWLLRRVESFQLAASQWVITLIGIVESLVMLRQAPSWRIVAGGAIIAASLTALWRIRNGSDVPVTLLTTRHPSRT